MRKAEGGREKIEVEKVRSWEGEKKMEGKERLSMFGAWHSGRRLFEVGRGKSDPSSSQKNGTSVFAFGYAATRCRGKDAAFDKLRRGKVGNKRS
jgi:hypothetical protein